MTVCAVYSGRAEIAPVCCAGSYAVTRASSIGEKKLARAPSLARVGRSAPRAPGQPPPPLPLPFPLPLALLYARCSEARAQWLTKWTRLVHPSVLTGHAAPPSLPLSPTHSTAATQWCGRGRRRPRGANARRLARATQSGWNWVRVEAIVDQAQVTPPSPSLPY